MCNSVFVGLGRMLVIICNTLDMVGGIGLVALGVYLSLNDLAPEDMSVPLLVLGTFLCLASMASACGLGSKSCGCLLVYSAYAAIPIALSEFTLAITFLARKQAVVHFLESRGVTQDYVSELTNSTVPVVLFALGGVELLRLYVSLCMRRTFLNEMRKYKELTEEEEREEQRMNTEKRQALNAKYSQMRKKFQDKYSIKEFKKTDAALENSYRKKQRWFDFSSRSTEALQASYNEL